MPIKQVVMLGVVCLCVAPSLAYSCKAPDAPEFPDPETAKLPEMVKTQKSVKKYLIASKKFLKCTRSDTKHDLHVAEMKRVADGYNEVSLLYKARVRTERAVASSD